jgi:hypothetical protein
MSDFKSRQAVGLLTGEQRGNGFDQPVSFELA